MCFADFDTVSNADQAVGYFSEGFRIESSDSVGVVELARARNPARRPKRERE